MHAVHSVSNHTKIDEATCIGDDTSPNEQTEVLGLQASNMTTARIRCRRTRSLINTYFVHALALVSFDFIDHSRRTSYLRFLAFSPGHSLVQLHLVSFLHHVNR